MRLNFFLFFVMTWSFCTGQIAQYNHFPTMKPSHILDEKLDDISFAMSFRILESDYEGPLVRLRRASDNAELDFYHADNDIVDVDAINTWRAGANVYVVVWYDQSSLGRNAIQPTQNRQPRFFPNAAKPYFQGDGSNDHLEVQTSIQIVTNAGVNGTVLMVASATKKNQHTFGVLRGSNRWSSHVNWSNNNLYFDPGICCNNPRSYSNGASVGVWKQYTFYKTNTHVVARLNGVQKINGTHTKGRCTINDNFTIGWANGNQAWAHSTTLFQEFIMYSSDVSTAYYEEIENNAMTFWGL